MQFSFTKLENREWGVRAEGPDCHKLAGKTVEVRKRSGGTRKVKLGALVQKWTSSNKQPNATYTLPGKSNGAPPALKPKGTVTVNQLQLTELLTKQVLVVDGVTLVFAPVAEEGAA